jgi:hypothetical protein
MRVAPSRSQPRLQSHSEHELRIWLCDGQAPDRLFARTEQTCELEYSELPISDRHRGRARRDNG